MKRELRGLVASLICVLLFITSNATYAQEPPSEMPKGIGGVASNAVAVGQVTASAKDQPIPDAPPISTLSSLVRATTAKSVREQTYEPMLETQLFYNTDYAVYAWLHAKADYQGQTLRMAIRWIRPDGTIYGEFVSPWQIYGADPMVWSWIYVYGVNLPLGQWQVQFWIQPSGGNWAYLTTRSFQLKSGTLCNQYVTNGEFEIGNQGWPKSSNVGINNSYPHWGNQGAILGGSNNQSYFLYQEVTLPDSYSRNPTLALYFNIYTEDSNSTAYDFLRIQIRDSRGALLRTLDEINNVRYYYRYPSNAWQPLTWDLSDFAGQTIRIYFSAETDSTLTTSWYIDDVSLTSCPLDQPETREERLAKRFAPIVFIHPDDPYIPNNVSVLIDDAELKEDIPLFPDPVVVPTPSVDIFNTTQYYNEKYYLDIREKEVTNAASGTAYQNRYPNITGSDNPVLYAHVIDDLNGNPDQDGCLHCTVIQYWLFYYFNDWWNLHEGDWEMVQVTLDKDNNDKAVRAAYAQHGRILNLFLGGTRLDWEELPFKTDTHPWIFVASGSHASYFAPLTYSYPTDDDNTSTTGIAILPSETDDFRIFELNPQTIKRWSSTVILSNSMPGWINFEGRWGNGSWAPFFSGLFQPPPKGPRFGDTTKWGNPVGWSRELPWDDEQWPKEARSFRVMITGSVKLHLYDSLDRHVGLNASGGLDLQIPGSDYRTSQDELTKIISVSPTIPNTGYRVIIQSAGLSGTFELIIDLPDLNTGTMYRTFYGPIQFNPNTIGEINLGSSSTQNIGIQSIPDFTLRLDHDGNGTFESSMLPNDTNHTSIDTNPPMAIYNLSVIADPVQFETARLFWTTPQDDSSVEKIAYYDIRFATFPITLNTWKEATSVTNEPIPTAPGSLEQYDVTGLIPASTYYFAVRSVDEGHNYSEISNLALLESRGQTIFLPLIFKNN